MLMAVRDVNVVEAAVRDGNVAEATVGDGDVAEVGALLKRNLSFMSVLSELSGTRCYFAMKVMDKASLTSRKKLTRAHKEREILQLLDCPFLPIMYTHFETDMFSCLVMKLCPGGDLHTLRQRQPGMHFSEYAMRGGGEGWRCGRGGGTLKEELGLHKWQDWVFAPLGDISNAIKLKQMVALDYEIVLFQDGTEEVVKVCGVDKKLKVKLESLVNSNKLVADYRTRITGILAINLVGVTCSLANIKVSMKKLLKKGTIIIGHNLHMICEIRICRLCHWRKSS